MNIVRYFVGANLSKPQNMCRAEIRHFIKPFRMSMITRCTSTAKCPELIKAHPEIKTHDDLHKYSIEQPGKFWDFQATSLLTWHKKYSSENVMNCDMEKGIFKWFEDGQLNASVNCIDR